MQNVTLSDVRLSELTLQELPLLGSLLKRNLSEKPVICTERARYITQSLKRTQSSREPMAMRYAGAVGEFLSRKSVNFSDDNLLAGSTTSKPFGVPVYPELTGLTIWPELDTISRRNRNPQTLSAEDAEVLNLEVFPFWMNRNIIEATRRRIGGSQGLKLLEKIVFFLSGKAGAMSHTVPCYRTVLEKGLGWLIAEALRRESEAAGKPREGDRTVFYRSMRTVLEGLLTYARNLGLKASALAAAETAPERRKHFLDIAEVCAQVPAGPARSFREAVNSLWILQVAIHAENINMAVSPGRLDQLLYPWYRRDIDSGVLTVRDALELVGCLWLKLNDNTNLVPETAEELFGGAGTVPAVTLGGVDENGEDAVNDLTYIMLRVTELLKTRDPSVNARYHPERNGRDYLKRVAEVVADTKCVPAFYNDLSAIRTLENQGVRTEHARDYAIIGCVELSASGRSYDASSSIMLNLAAALELALYDGKRPVTGDEQIGPRTGSPAEFQNFADFLKAFRTQLEWLIEQAVALNEEFGRTHQLRMTTPLLSALFEGPMESGKDLIFGGATYNSSGATHIGFADVVDSLNAIEQGVFVEKRFSLPQLIAALEEDFCGAEPLRAWLVNRAPKYGSGNPDGLKNAYGLISLLYEIYQGHMNYRGGRYRPAFWTMTNHAGQGKLCGALPNGRRAHVPFASGITPVSQAAPDLTECLLAVGGIDPLHIPGGEAFNLKMIPVAGADDLDRLAGAVAGYFDAGGLHVQFNIMSYDMLRRAKEHPEDYPDLLVRVSGYSAYFRDLNGAMQDEIINRTAYATATGKALPLPPAAGSPVAPCPDGTGEVSFGTVCPELRPLLKGFLDCITSGIADNFLGLLLEVMKTVFFFDHEYRKNIEGFEGKYVFRSVDRSVLVSASFGDELMQVLEEEIADPDAAVLFKDGKSLMNFLLADNPDILGSMLRQEIATEGNLNYIYKFAYMARRLQLMAKGEA